MLIAHVLGAATPFRDAMTTSKPNRPDHLNRRQVVLAGAAATAAVPVALAMARQSASPEATPGASPIASPQPAPPPPTPTPQPVPTHKLNIVRSRASYGSPATGGDIRLYIQSGGLQDGNPAMQTQDMTLLMSVFDGLVRINPETMMAEPGLAESWSWSEDNLQLTFKLRKDVSWHDGSAFTATDAALTCMIYRDDYDSALAGLFGLIDSAEAVNASTLLLTFAAPDGAFVFNGASMPMLPAAQHQAIWDALPLGEKSISRPDLTPANWIGTGPWKMGEVSESQIELVRFDEYWDGAALADNLTLVVEDDAAARLAGWKSGDVDVLPVNAAQVNEVWGETGNLFVAPSATAMFAAINFHNPANATSTMMVDQSLRTALNMAVNRDRYADDVFFGFINEHAVGTMAQPWLHDSSLQNPAYDPEGARQVLADGGWADIDGDGLLEDGYGNKTDLFLIVREDERPELLSLLGHLQEDWAKIGVRLTIQHLFPEIFDQRWVEDRQFDLIAYSLVNYPAFNEFDLYGSQWDIRSNVRGWNPGGYFNPGVDAAIQEWFGATDPDAMTAAAGEIQRLTNEDLFGIWFGFPNDLVLVREDLQGFNSDMFLTTQYAHRWWRGTGEPMTATPVGTPVASPVVDPVSTPQD